MEPIKKINESHNIFKIEPITRVKIQIQYSTNLRSKHLFKGINKIKNVKLMYTNFLDLEIFPY